MAKKTTCVASIVLVLVILVACIVFLRIADSETVGNDVARMDYRASWDSEDDRVTLTSFKKVKAYKVIRCGRQFKNREERIVGGKVASIGEFP